MPTQSQSPIFLISLPRSGSTFLQKILMSHLEVDSSSETWFLLPLFYMDKKEGVKAEYGHQTSVYAYKNIMLNVANKSFKYDLIRKFSESIYNELGSGASYFLDKTPRYYLILDEIYKCFPGAKFIVLFRNPVSLFASNIDYFLEGKMRRLDHLDHDFYTGPNLIGSFVQSYTDEVHIVRYEDLISNPESTVENICDYLNIPYQKDMINESFKVKLAYGLSDNNSETKYKKVRENDIKWKGVIDSRVRKIRLLSYLRKYPSNYLDIAGYSIDKLISSVSLHSVHKIGVVDFIFWLEEIAIRAIKRLMRYKY